MSRWIRDLSAGSAAMLDVFGDAALLRHALAFEAALAMAQADAGLISRPAAERIAAAARDLVLDPLTLAAEAAHAGTLAIPLVAHLRHAVGDENIACHVHCGATSQDVADTALMLQVQAGMALIRQTLNPIRTTLAGLAQHYAAAPMLGRTLLQAALPITFGLKAANWLSGLDEAAARLEDEARHGLVLQFGGAAGTRAGLSGKGASVAAQIAQALGLSDAALPWHATRGHSAGLGTALAILTGATAKIARDIALLSQIEIAEVFEPRLAGRGGSSTMAHKRNPTGCQTVMAAAQRTPQLAATLIAALPQELERGLGGWQAEAPVLAELFVLCQGALEAMAPVLAALEVSTTRMAANLAAAHVGQDIGESQALVEAMLAARMAN